MSLGKPYHSPPAYGMRPYLVVELRPMEMYRSAYGCDDYSGLLPNVEAVHHLARSSKQPQDGRALDIL